jgi:hypothetical protein
MKPIATDATMETSPYVRSDVSVAVIIALLVGVGAGLTVHWAVFTLTIAFSYMAIGLSTVREWNKQLQTDGKAPRAVFSNVRAAAFLPALVIVTSLYFAGTSFYIAGTVSLLILVGYMYALYAVGFAGTESDRVHFEDDPYTGERFIWQEETYIPRLEAYSLEQATEKD